MMRLLARREPESAVVRWNPFREMEQFRREMDELFNRFFDWRPTLATPTELEFSPALDVYETPEEFVVFVTAPGVAEKDLHVELSNNTLTVSGERKALIEGENVQAHYVSRMGGYGKFSVSYTLPVPIDENKVRAVYRNGVLEVRLPKAESAKPKTVKVEFEK
ncbi:MAG: Hsp20/alpha crystallin family protein [Fimbriimonadales bacterium]|nr:Hsp20/alpha crystallin family protein [Fimbriimonadales bacterium]